MDDLFVRGRRMLARAGTAGQADALRLFLDSAEAGHEESMACVAKLLILSSSDEADNMEGLKLLIGAVAKRSVAAEVLLGRVYVFGSASTEVDGAETRRHLISAAEDGEDEASYLLGGMFGMGLGAEHNLSLARRYLHEAVEGDRCPQAALHPLVLVLCGLAVVWRVLVCYFL